MTSRAFLFFLLSGTICFGQSVLTTPDVQTQPAQTGQSAPATGAAMAPIQGQAPIGGSGQMSPQMPVVSPAEQRDQLFSPIRIVGPLRTRSEFEQFAEDATGRRLPVYGRQLFDEAPTTFAPVENVPVPADYVLGPGDQLLIRAWGKIDLDSRVTVDRNGQINLPKVGTLTVAGLHYAQVQGYLHSAISGLFKDFELNVTLGQLRSIQIFVLGNARQPGAYTVSSLSTLVDALFTSGGPSAIGTMRRIQLRRDGQTTTEFDIYDLAEKGDKSHDVRLLPGDVIFIPAIGPQIAISGDVNQPGIYELKGEATVGTALENAGGMTSLADAERAVLERIESHSSREVEEFALDASGRARVLRDGDLLRVFPLSPKLANAVTLRGNVAEPGLYLWKDGMHVSDLIPSRAFLVTRDYWNQQNHLVRPGPENPFAIRRTDAFGNPCKDAYGNQDTNANRNLEANSNGNQDTNANRNLGAYSNGNQDTNANRNLGANSNRNQDMNACGNQGANAPGDQSMDSTENSSPDALGNPRTKRYGQTNSRTITSIGQNSAEINWEYALIERLDERDLSTRLVPFNLRNALDNPAAPDNQVLKPGDVVTIFSRADLELPMEKHSIFVRVGGEVSAPGVYRVNPGETLRDVVEKARGLTQHSYLYAAIFTRVSTRLAQEVQLKQSADQMQRELAIKYANATPQAGQTGADQQAQLAMQQATLARLTLIQPTGRVVLEMRPEAATVADIPNFPIEDGDAFYIPPRLSTVQVAGSVYNANAFRYQPGKRLVAYLNDAGGATREADRKRIYVIRADGTVVSRQSRKSHFQGSYDNMKLLPGDAIVVPEKLRVSSPLNAFLQTTQLASQLALTAVALSAVK